MFIYIRYHIVKNNNTMMPRKIRSTSSRKVSWSMLKSPFPSRIKGKSKKANVNANDGLPKKLNVNEEYKAVFRTQSYGEIRSKVQVHLNGSTPIFGEKFSLCSSSSSSSHSSSRSSSNSSSSSPHPFYDQLLEPRQEEAIDMIKSFNFKSQLIDYFDGSLDACNLCESLLRGIHETRFNNQLIKRVIESSSNGFQDSNDKYSQRVVIEDLDSFARLKNPLSIVINNGALDFCKIHANNALLLRKLLSKGKKIKWFIKYTRLYKKTIRYGCLIAYIVLAIALLAIATHSVVGILATPGIFMTIPLGVMKKPSGSGGGGIKGSFLIQLASQLDEAAKGMYILINNFDTMGMLLRRVHDEVEHAKALAKICVTNKTSPEVVKEALRELCVQKDGFVEQLEELEEHVYLCFLTIIRSRRSVIQKIMSS